VHVDAGQLTSETVVARARELLKREGRLDPDLAEEEVPGYPDLHRRAAALAAARRGLRPPELGTSRAGAAGRAATLAKRAVRKATYWYVEPRLAAQGQFDDEVVSLAGELGVMQRTIEGATSSQSNSLKWLSEQTELALRSLRTRCETLEQQVAELRAELMLRARGADVADLRRQVSELAQGSLGLIPDIDYVAFEERFRGTSQSVRATQKEYVQLFVDSPDTGPVVDIGCGRGEMLSLLLEAGVESVGIDIDDEMLEACRAQGLAVAKASAVDWLRNQDDGSLRGIFLAQVVEHLPTVDLVALVREAARTLAPGGVFVAETIDPRSLYATANYFWADLSHIRPVHPATLAFLLDQAGFAETTVLERSPHPFLTIGDEVEDEATREAVTELARTVFGTQDYAVVGHR
jgi:O-antigen chain-terminating methyltransferase